MPLGPLFYRGLKQMAEDKRHITDPLSAKEIRDALGVTDEDLEAARRAIGETINKGWANVTYPIPIILQRDWLYDLWKRVMCGRGYHLLDDVWSVEEHSLYCDACGLTLFISGWEMEDDSVAG